MNVYKGIFAIRWWRTDKIWPESDVLLIICGSEAWDAISRYIYTGMQGGSIMKDWMRDENTMITCCNDGPRPVIFKIERIDYDWFDALNCEGVTPYSFLNTRSKCGKSLKTTAKHISDTCFRDVLSSPQAVSRLSMPPTAMSLPACWQWDIRHKMLSCRCRRK